MTWDIRHLEVRAMFAELERAQWQEVAEGYEWRLHRIREIKRNYSHEYYWRMRLDPAWREKEKARCRNKGRRTWAALCGNPKRLATHYEKRRLYQRTWGNANYHARRKDPAWREAKRAREREAYRRREAEGRQSPSRLRRRPRVRA